MATASAGRPAVLIDRPSSFSQFRLTQFVDNAPKPPNAISDVDHASSLPLQSSQAQDIEQMAQASGPSLGQNPGRAPSVALSRPPPQVLNHSTSSPGLGQLELVELTSNPLIEGILGPNKDGRVRNPVPSKLKGKTDNKQGNFGVMHMGASPGKKSEAQTKDAAAERDAAARRTSENTASRAKAAQQEKYIPPKKRGMEASSGDLTANRASPFAVSKDDHRQRSRPLAPDETKYEQARLLTLLRSINPVTVVDQICKAVAYFGGIPGAPPPEDGIFPESANTRETGALFIGWLAEIFPDLSPRSPEAVKKEAASSGANKKRGRPSKGNVATPSGTDAVASEAPNSRNGYGYGPAVSAPAWGLPQSLALVNTPIPVPAVVENGQPASSEYVPAKQSEQPPPETPTRQLADESAASAAKRRRGRPKGSRNKGGKGDGPQSGEGGGSTNVEQEAQSKSTAGQEGHQAPEVRTNATQVASTKPSPAFAQQVNSQAGGSKPANTFQFPAQQWGQNPQKKPAAQTSTISTADELSPEERAVLEAFRQQGPEAGTAAPSPVVAVKDMAGQVASGPQKRKRAPPKPKPPPTPPQPAVNPPANNPPQSQYSTILPPNKEASVAVPKDSFHWAHLDPSTSTAAPPAKKPRQRKPKVPAAVEAPSRTQTASVVSSATPPIPPSTIPDSQATTSQQSLPVTRPPAEGLEAHYERFANLGQQNGRSITPTTAPQQQHKRQQSKATSVTPQQSTPQMQQQQMQMQNQKSQQGIQQSVQREEPKMAQASAARSSSGPFTYNAQSQRSTSYSQQYPSHQPSQLYGSHQASPQMSAGSYRTSTTHTMPQTSPQFSQSESTYRTASPHALTQPSPSYPQTDTNFRTTSTHSIPQQSPSFSQPESTYRTPSTHSVAQQPTPSYTSSRPQAQPSQQSQYNHFSDSSYIDLPTLESLGHSGSTGNTNVSMSAGGYGQGQGLASLGNSTTRSTGSYGTSSGTNNSLYGTSSGNSTSPYGTSSGGIGPYDTNDILRGVSRSASNTNSGYGTASAGLGAFDTATSEHEMRERLLRGLGRR